MGFNFTDYEGFYFLCDGKLRRTCCLLLSGRLKEKTEFKCLSPLGLYVLVWEETGSRLSEKMGRKYSGALSIGNLQISSHNEAYG